MLSGSDGRLVRDKWAGLDSDLPAAGKRYPRNDNIRFPLPSKNLDQGNLAPGRDPLKKSGPSLFSNSA